MQYTIKTFSKAWAYKKTINPKVVKNDISFSSQIDGGLWELVLLLDLSMTNTDFLQGDQIKVWKDKTIIYWGFIDSVDIKATNYEEIEVRATWYFSLFSRLYYEESNDYTIKKTDDPKEIIDDIIDFFNIKYNVLSKDTQTVWDSIAYDTDYTDLLKIIGDMKAMSDNYFWFVDESWVFKFKPKATDAQNKLTFAKDIFTLNVIEDTTKIVNRVFLKTKETHVDMYEDSASQALYGVREKVVSNMNIDDHDAADAFGNEYISQNKDPKKTITLTVSSEYSYKDGMTFEDLWDDTFTDLWDKTFEDLVYLKNIESIQPGETVAIKNISKDFGTLLITKKVYTPYSITLTLDNYENFISLIKE